MTEFDRQLLNLLSSQRVLTQTQLERLHSDVPVRTLRYRTERLHRLGLLGRSRPYRETGSAPFHLWPTRRADAFVRGESVPAGGERPQPNPLFLAHAAALSELYVLLTTQAEPFGLSLRGFQCEGEARERFRAAGRERALAPDALLDLRDEQGRQLVAFVELDLGTMSHARLRAKAAGYADYAVDAAWSQRHPFCPCLLFLTTSDARAISFVKALQAALEKADRSHGSWVSAEERSVEWFAAGVCAMAHEPARALAEHCWDDLTLAGGLTLLDCLERARAPYDQWWAREQAQRRARERALERLLSNLETLRAHLRAKRGFELSRYLSEFGDEGETALTRLLESDTPIEPLEADALRALAHQLGDDLVELRGDERPPEPGLDSLTAISCLVEHYRDAQRSRLALLVRRYGQGPQLREQRAQLETGKLLDPFAEQRLEQIAEREQQARQRQERLRLAYLERRARDARRLARERGLAARFLHGPAAFYGAVDRRWLRFCRRCQEIAYPQPDEQPDPFHHRATSRNCHFCGSSQLDDWDDELTVRLSSGHGYGLAGLDLRPSGIDGFMDDPEDEPEPKEW